MAWFRTKKEPVQPQPKAWPEIPATPRADQIGFRYDEMKALARAGDLDGEWAIIVKDMFDVEKEAIENNWMPAPAVYKRVAVSLRKQKRYAIEVQILERFQKVNEKFRNGQSLYNVSAELYERLEKARTLRDAHTSR